MKKILVVFVLCILLNGCASVTPHNETYMGKAVFDVDISNQPNSVVDTTYKIISSRVQSLTKNVAFMPNPLPETPGVPNLGMKSMSMGMLGSFSIPQCGCDGAYAIMGGNDKGVSSSAMGTSDSASYNVCIYPYKEAYRIYIIGNFQSSSDGGVQGFVADSIKKGITSAAGQKGLFASWFDQLIQSFRKAYPNAKEIEISMP